METYLISCSDHDVMHAQVTFGLKTWTQNAQAYKALCWRTMLRSNYCWLGLGSI